MFSYRLDTIKEVHWENNIGCERSSRVVSLASINQSSNNCPGESIMWGQRILGVLLILINELQMTMDLFDIIIIYVLLYVI